MLVPELDILRNKIETQPVVKKKRKYKTHGLE